MSRDPIEERGGVNLYAPCKNDPVNKIDRLGMDIYLTEGNNNEDAGYWNRSWHQEICVDTWTNDPKNPCCKKKGNRMCYSFAYTEFGFDWPSTGWLGRKSPQSGGPLRGEVYETGDQGLKNLKTLKTTCKQDEEFLDMLRDLEGTSATYSLFRHNCRAFSQMIFDEASKSYAPGSKEPNNPDCECSRDQK